MRSQPDRRAAAIYPRRPEVRIFALFDAVQLERIAGRVHLQVEYARLHRLLILGRQAARRCRHIAALTD